MGFLDILGIVLEVLVGLIFLGIFLNIMERLLSEEARANWKFLFFTIFLIFQLSHCSSPHI